MHLSLGAKERLDTVRQPQDLRGAAMVGKESSELWMKPIVETEIVDSGGHYHLVFGKFGIFPSMA